MEEHIDWVKIMESEMGLKVEVSSAHLSDENIPNVILDKKDSAYVVLGRKELYVPNEWVERAREILEEKKDSE